MKPASAVLIEDEALRDGLRFGSFGAPTHAPQAAAASEDSAAVILNMAGLGRPLARHVRRLSIPVSASEAHSRNSANRSVAEALEGARGGRLPANRVLQERIGYLLKRPVGRPSVDVRRSHANFIYQAGSWTKPRRVVAKVERRPGELYPRVGFIVANLARPAENVVVFYNKRGACEQWIKEGKGAIKWMRLSRHSFAANAVRLQLHALAYNLGNFDAKGGRHFIGQQRPNEAIDFESALTSTPDNTLHRTE